MTKMFRFGSTLSAIAVVAVLAGCASPMSKGQAVAGKANSANFALASRALAALKANDFESAIDLAERAVEAKPQDPVLRTLLGNSYLASGRFASAESAFRDSLSLRSNQPDVILKLSLAMIAQGKGAAARAFLDAGAGMIDRADYGLALALAGWPSEAALILEQAARHQGADARVRQNLALSHALAGDWEAARVVAAQDLPAGMVDARVQEWMVFAQPAQARDQVAALVGVIPAASDPGQPQRLALNSGNDRFAALEAQPVVAPEQVSLGNPAPSFEQPETAYYAPQPEPALATEAAVVPAYEPAQTATAATSHAPRPAPAFEAPPQAAPRQAAAAKPVRSVRVALPAAKPATPLRGNSNSVVQLGAYGSPQRVETAWNQIARRHSSLRAYTPVSARFDGPNGTVYRLAVKGFVSDDQARDICIALRREGGTCFVRTMAGDSPVRFASR